MTSADADGKGTVKVTGVTKTGIKQLRIPAVIKYEGITFRVTEIGTAAFKNCKKAASAVIGKNVKTIRSKAFYGCKKLKKLTVSTSVLKKVEKNAFKGIHAKAKIKVPAKKYKKYKKLLRGKGQKSSVKITK